MSEAPEESPESPEPTSESSTAESEQLPQAPADLAAKARDLGELRAAVVEAANVGTGLWLSYLFALFYFLIALGGISHRNLFFENPVRLPFLNVDLPLIGFFLLGPLIFLIVHAYVLLHFVLLATKIGVFDTELRLQIPDDDLRTRLRRQLPSNIFVQYLAGPRDVRSGVTGIMLQAIALISLVIGPIALLVFFQLRFLPYHQEIITWWHRIAIVIDLSLLWLLWPSIARGGTIAHAWRGMRRGVVAGIALLSLVPILLTFTIATFPGEWLEDHLPYNALHDMLVVGDVDLAAREPTSLWPNRLVLPGLDVVDHTRFDSEAKLTSSPETVSLRTRHLEGAMLIGAILRKADFTGAQLRGARLDGADLRGVQFGCEHKDPADPTQPLDEHAGNVKKEVCANLTGAILNGALMQRALLDGADLHGAELDGTQLQEASLNDANLRGAKLDRTNLQGASLRSARIQFASVNGTMLQGATLDGADLQGSSLQVAHLQAASLHGTQLQGADLSAAELQAALLTKTKLHGATMYGTYLDGAIFNEAELQGVDFRPQSLRSTSFQNVMVWRATAQAPFQQDMITGLITSATRTCTPQELHSGKQVCNWSAEDYNSLRKGLEDGASGNALVPSALNRIERLDPRINMDRDGQSAERWAAQERTSPARDAYEKTLAEQWASTGCKAEGAPYVIRALVDRLNTEFASPSPHPAALAATFLDDKRCPGARGLSDDVKAQLERIRDSGTHAIEDTPAH